MLNPLAKDDADPRARPFLHLVHTILPKLSAQGSLPRYLLIENVAGFEVLSLLPLELLSETSVLDFQYQIKSAFSLKQSWLSCA